MLFPECGVTKHVADRADDGWPPRVHYRIADPRTLVVEFRDPDDLDAFVARYLQGVTAKGELLTKGQHYDVVEPALHMGDELRAKYEPRLAAKQAEVQRLEAQLAAPQARERELRVENAAKHRWLQRIVDNSASAPEQVEAARAQQRRLTW